MSNLKKVQRVSEETSKYLAKLQTRHIRLVKKSIKNLEDNIIDSVRSLGVRGRRVEGIKINLKQTQQVHKDIMKIMEKEYNIPMKKMINDFDEISEFIRESYKYLGEAAKFTGMDKTILNTLKNDSYEQFKQFGVEAQDKINRAMYDTVIAQGKFSDLVRTISGALFLSKDVKGRSMSMYANQYAFDSVMNFHNKVNISKAEELGFDRFLYVGDIMKTTREFCSVRAGGVYTKEEIESWTFSWTGKAGPAMLYRGGYNCRHHWRPVRKEWMEGKEKIDIADWNLEEAKRKPYMPPEEVDNLEWVNDRFSTLKDDELKRAVDLWNNPEKWNTIDKIRDLANNDENVLESLRSAKAWIQGEYKEIQAASHKLLTGSDELKRFIDKQSRYADAGHIIDMINADSTNKILWRGETRNITEVENFIKELKSQKKYTIDRLSSSSKYKDLSDVYSTPKTDKEFGILYKFTGKKRALDVSPYSILGEQGEVVIFGEYQVKSVIKKSNKYIVELEDLLSK